MFDDKKLDKLEKLINLVDEDYVKSDEFVEVFGVLVSLIKESNDSSEESIESLKKQAESIREVVLSERKLSRKLQEQFNNRLASFKTELENAIYEVKDLLPELREAKDGIDGKDGRDGKDGKDGSPDTGEQIVEKINSLNEKAPKIDASHIKNLPQTVTTIVEQGGRGFVETPIKAGSNVTVTKDASGAWVINSTSGGAGLVDGDYGDITVGGSGTTMTIDNLAVTNAKINDVAWSKVSGTPTTLAGYGITDAQPLDTQLTSLAGLSYTGNANKVVRVNAGETGFELATVSGGGDMVLADVQSVTGLKTFDKDKLAMKGTSTGVTTISTANTGASNYTATLQAASGTIAYTSDIPSLAGYVNTTGTPADNQIAIFTDADTVEGVSGLTYNSSTLQFGSGAAAGILQSNGNFDLTLRTGNAVTGSINITDGANGAIDILANGSGNVNITTGTGDIVLTSNTSYFDIGNDYWLTSIPSAGYSFRNGSVSGVLDMSSIATSSKTFTFPNSSGTIALTANPTDITVPDEAYGAGWNGSLEVPTKNAIYDKIESMSAGSGITRTVVVTSGSATMGSTASTDYVYFVAGAHTMSLPAASGNTNRYTIKNNHSANITVDTAGAENIEGAASISIAPEESVDIISDGTNWFVV